MLPPAGPSARLFLMPICRPVSSMTSFFFVLVLLILMVPGLFFSVERLSLFAMASKPLPISRTCPMKLEFDYSCFAPCLIVHFDSVEALVEFLVGFWRLLSDG